MWFLIESFFITPNPSKGIFQIQTERTGILSVYDLTGKQILQENINSFIQKIDISTSPSGIYILTFNDGNQVYQNKLIKK